MHKMYDAAEEARKAKLAEWSEWLDSHEERLERAKERLGSLYLLHPENRVQRRVTPYGSIR